MPDEMGYRTLIEIDADLDELFDLVTALEKRSCELEAMLKMRAKAKTATPAAPPSKRKRR